MAPKWRRAAQGEGTSWIFALSSRPNAASTYHRIHNAPSTDRDMKAERQPESKQKWGRRPKQQPSQVITTLPIKSFAARLGGESVAGMIHHCSVSQITDRPSPPRRSSESQINWPDTSNDSPWKTRRGSQTQALPCTFKKKKEIHSRWVSQTITPWPMMAPTNMAPNCGACLNVWIVSLRQHCDFFFFFSEEVITTQGPGTRGTAGLE